MKEIVVNSNQAGQRLDKLLKKVLDKSPSSFVYKMLRKKNIKLNDKKASGSEMLSKDDIIKIFLSDETFDKFSSYNSKSNEKRIEDEGFKRKITIIYEDDNVIILNKPAGLLVQSDKKNQYSLDGFVKDYISSKDMGFSPGICNRLDRNTSGIVIAGKSLAGLQKMSELIRARDIKKIYIALVDGVVKESGIIEKWMVKDRENNKVSLFDKEVNNSKYSKTGYEPIKTDGENTLLKIDLFTGRTHQIRSHLASIGHPIIGDIKYGNQETKRRAKRQLLHAYSIVFPEMDGQFGNLSGREFFAELPDDMKWI